ncbi:MAG TPA: hypothetical protein ACN46L_06745, partial [Prochlorococcus sp.]
IFGYFALKQLTTCAETSTPGMAWPLLVLCIKAVGRSVSSLYHHLLYLCALSYELRVLIWFLFGD